MGPRPRDFDEELVRRSPTFRKWEGLMPGAKLRYACREFVKGQGDDEERLMRRIMIARRNNVRDHQALKWARRMQSSVMANDADDKAAIPQDEAASKAETNGNKIMENTKRENYVVNSRREAEAIISRTSHLLQGAQEAQPGRRSRRPTTLISDEAIKEEMDVHAVEATRSYKTWLSLPNGTEFLYNQKYIKGQESHDWLLKKNIWRRMRYRRENKKMVEQMLSRERGQVPLMAERSRKRRHDETSMVRSPMTSNDGPMNEILVDATSPTMVANPTMATVPPLSARSETNPQEVVASTASEIVDHALLSTNTGVVVPSPAIVPTAGNGITISIGDQQQQQQPQHSQQHQSPQALHHHHHHHHHHHDATESAAAFAASIALAGVGIGTDGDLNAHHETAVADSAAVEAAVAAALAATDAKSNSYHHHQMVDVNPHAELMEVNHVVHEPPVAAETAPPTTAATEEMVPGLGLALDAAAKLAAAAATQASDEAVLAATKAMTAVTKGEKEGPATPGTTEV